MPRLTTAKQKQNKPLVVVAGGAGFIGSHLSESLLNSGVEVIGLDDLVTGSMANIASFRRHPHYEFVECNVNQKIPDSILERPVTHVIHAMGIDTHSLSQNATLASLLTGSFGTKNLLDLSVKKGATFLLLSTINIYEGMVSSTSLDHYFGSTDNQKAQYSHFEAKRYAEGLCQMYADEYNLDVRVVRLSEVYGPRMDLCDSTFLDTMLQQTLDGSDLIVQDDGNQEIYLTYVDDAVYGISKLLFAEGEQFHRSIYPLVSSEKTSIISVAYTLRTFLPPGKEIKFMPQAHKADFRLPKVSFERAKRDLDWEPEVNITDGLKLTVESFRKGSSQQQRQHKVGRELLSTMAPVLATESVRPAAGVQIKNQAEKKVDFPAQPVLVPLMDGEGSALNNNLPFRSKRESLTPDSSEAVAASTAAVTNKNTTSSGKKQEKRSGLEVKKRPASWWKRLLFAAVLIGLYAALGRPLLHTVSYAVAGGLAMQQGRSAVESLDFKASADHFSRAQDYLAEARQASTGLGWPASVVGLGQTQHELEQGLAALATTADGLTTLSVAGEPWPGQLHELLQFHNRSDSTDATQAATTDIQALVDQSKIGLRQSRQQFSQAISLLSGSESTKVAGASMVAGEETIGERGLLAGFLQSARNLLVEAQTMLDQADQALDVLPQVLGADDKKSYLAVFQNSNELRPTGGFMGSYALIQVEQGRISTFKIDDMYNPDGQLHTDLPAPAPLQQELGVSQLFIRDANWSADVVTSGRQVADLYEAATKESIDGVLFITTKAIKPLLSSLGPLHLENFNETVTADNFAMLAQEHSNVGFVPGSTGKRDFLGVLAETLLARIEQGDSGDWLKAGQAITQGLHNREIQLYAEDPAVALLIDQQDWSGRTKVTDGDYLRVVDANVGANKSNYYVTRQTEYSVNVDRDSHLSGVAKISWQHTGTSGTWPGGNYRNYVRLYVPLGSTLIGASNFDVEQLDVYAEGDKQVFGGYVTVPYDSQKTVEVAYALPARLGLLENSGDYNLLWQKQSGTGTEDLMVAFNAPIFLDASQISSGGTNKDGQIVWHKDGSTDFAFEAHLQQD